MNTNKYEHLVNIKVKINETGYDIFLEKVFNSLNTKLNKKDSVDDEVDDSVDDKVDYSVDDKVDYSVDVKVFYKSENLDNKIEFKIEYTTSSSGIATVEYIYAKKTRNDGHIDGHDYNNYTYEFYEEDIINNKLMKKTSTKYVIELPINLLYVYLIDVLKQNIEVGKFNITDIEEITTKSDEYNPPKEPEMPVEVAGEKYLHNIKNYGKTVKDAVIEKYKDDIKVWSEQLNEYQENYIRKYGIHKFAIMHNKYESKNKMSWLPSLKEVAAKAAKAEEAAKAAKAEQTANPAKVERRSLKELYGILPGIGG
jgi:hypothetical protein